MAKSSKTPLEQKFLQLPRIVDFTRDIKPKLSDAGISVRTFQRDRKAIPNSIPSWRIQIYAALFNCEMADLMDSFVKIKPLVKTKLAKKAGLKV